MNAEVCVCVREGGVSLCVCARLRRKNHKCFLGVRQYAMNEHRSVYDSGTGMQARTARDLPRMTELIWNPDLNFERVIVDWCRASDDLESSSDSRGLVALHNTFDVKSGTGKRARVASHK